jgi:predicted ATPase
MMAVSLLFTGGISEARRHFDQAIVLYDSAAHRSLAARFGADIRVSILCYRSFALWLLGFPEGALKDADDAVKYARESSHAATLMLALSITISVRVWCGKYLIAKEEVDELANLADKKEAMLRKATAMAFRGCLFALTRKASESIETINLAIADFRLTGSTMMLPGWLPYLANAYAELEQFEDAWRCVGEAMISVKASKETWCEAEIQRVAGEIALRSSEPEPDVAKAESYFERALAVAREQQAKSWELRAAMSMARLWRNQGKRQQAHDLLAPIYYWFTEGFDTLDLKQAKALLEELR